MTTEIEGRETIIDFKMLTLLDLKMETEGTDKPRNVGSLQMLEKAEHWFSTRALPEPPGASPANTLLLTSRKTHFEILTSTTVR